MRMGRMRMRSYLTNPAPTSSPTPPRRAPRPDELSPSERGLRFMHPLPLHVVFWHKVAPRVTCPKMAFKMAQDSRSWLNSASDRPPRLPPGDPRLPSMAPDSLRASSRARVKMASAGPQDSPRSNLDWLVGTREKVKHFYS